MLIATSIEAFGSFARNVLGKFVVGSIIHRSIHCFRLLSVQLQFWRDVFCVYLHFFSFNNDEYVRILIISCLTIPLNLRRRLAASKFCCVYCVCFVSICWLVRIIHNKCFQFFSHENNILNSKGAWLRVKMTTNICFIEQKRVAFTAQFNHCVVTFKIHVNQGKLILHLFVLLWYLFSRFTNMKRLIDVVLNFFVPLFAYNAHWHLERDKVLVSMTA